MTLSRLALQTTMASTKALTDTFKLNSGATLPILGFGVYKSPKEVTVKSVTTALKAGYRHIDCAQYYENEVEVGEAVKASGISRKDVFVTTKTFINGSSPEETYKGVLESVNKVNLDGYVDLFLIHTPSGGPEARKGIWQALERLHKEGKAKSIGVSNYGVKHLEEMKSYATVPAAVNQTELHPWLQQEAVTNYCKKENIAIEAYCPIARNTKSDDPTLLKLAKKHNKETAQVLLRWSIQKGFSPLPKSDTPSRIQSNADIYDFELDDEDMKTLNDLEVGPSAALAPYNADCA